MQMTRKQKYRRVLLALAALFLILAVLLGYDAMRESLPDTMYVDENSESPFQPLTKHPLLTISEDTKEAEKTEFGETGETVVECSAAGIPLKKIRVIQEERPKVAVCGAPVGIYMETDGVMVIRTAEIRSSDGTVSRPSENILREGDYITKVNGQSIRSKQELIDAVKVSNGSPVCLSLLRDGDIRQVHDIRQTPAQRPGGPVSLHGVPAQARDLHGTAQGGGCQPEGGGGPVRLRLHGNRTEPLQRSAMESVMSIPEKCSN